MQRHPLFNHRDRAEPTRIEHRILFIAVMQDEPVVSQELHRRRLKIEVVKIVPRNSRFKAVHNLHDDCPLAWSQLVKRLDQIVAKSELVARLGKW